jgi:hypothetical protein
MSTARRSARWDGGGPVAVSRLERWRQLVTYRSLRQVEELHTIKMPDGSPLRGIRLTPGVRGVFLARDLQFYVGTPEGYAHPILAEDLEAKGYGTGEFEVAWRAARARAQERREAKSESGASAP